MPETPTLPLTVRLPPELLEAVHVEAAHRGQTLKVFVTRALQAALPPDKQRKAA